MKRKTYGILPLKILTVTVLFAGSILIMLPSAVDAINNPDSDPTIANVKANRNLIESGDVLIYGDIDIPYATSPNETSTEAYIIKLYNGATEVGRYKLSEYLDRGWNLNSFFFYFTASDNLTWNVGYTVKISQNPSLFTNPTTVSYVIPASAYTFASTQEANQIELSNNLIDMAERLQVDHTDFTLVEDAPGGSILSSPDGVTYFRSACYGIQLMAPDVFLIQVLEIDTTYRDWETTQFDTYSGRYTGTWAGNATANTTAQFGLSQTTTMGVVFILPICTGVVILSMIKWRRSEPGILVSAVVLASGALMGWVGAAIFANVYQIMALYLAYVWFYARG